MKKITYNFENLTLRDMVITDDRDSAMRHMTTGKHLYCLPQMFNAKAGLFILGVPLDKEGQYLETTRNLTTSEAEAHLLTLENSTREQCSRV